MMTRNLIVLPLCALGITVIVGASLTGCKPPKDNLSGTRKEEPVVLFQPTNPPAYEVNYYGGLGSFVTVTTDHRHECDYVEIGDDIFCWRGTNLLVYTHRGYQPK